MRLTGHSRFAVTFLLSAVAVVAAADTPYLALARLATALSQNDGPAALAEFDHSMPDYGAVESAIQALTAQTDVLCAIEIVEQKDSVADTDWYLQLKPRGEGGEAVRRRSRVSVTLREIRGKWRIVALTPLSILAPITVR
jgi:hypothetical protein